MVYLELQISIRSASADYRHMDEIETFVHEISKSRKGVKIGIPSAAECADGSTVESFFLVAKNDTIAESVADTLIVETKQWGEGKHGIRAILIKRVGTGDEVVEYCREILPKPGLSWTTPHHTLPGEHDTEDKTEWPARLQYLAKTARRYYSAGGNDVVAVFRNPKELHHFIAGLSKQDMAELQVLATQIVSNSDHTYITDWFNEDTGGKVSWPQAHALYLLALLDRLREAGVFDTLPNVKQTQFVDWNAVGG